MAFTGSFLCNSFKKAILDAEMDFSSDTAQTFYMALYDNTATLTASTTAYPGAGVGGELAATGGYTQGGNALTLVPASLDSGTAIIDFDDEPWTTATFTARGALIYLNNGGTNPAIAVIDFGADKEVSSGTFTVQFPAAAAATAIIRIA